MRSMALIHVIFWGWYTICDPGGTVMGIEAIIPVVLAFTDNPPATMLLRIRYESTLLNAATPGLVKLWLAVNAMHVTGVAKPSRGPMVPSDAKSTASDGFRIATTVLCEASAADSVIRFAGCPRLTNALLRY